MQQTIAVVSDLINSQAIFAFLDAWRGDVVLLQAPIIT